MKLSHIFVDTNRKMDVINSDSCRICLNNQGEISIFEKKSDSDDCYYKKILFCTSIQVFEDDPMPKTICFNCANRLNEACTLKELALNSDNVLKDKFNNIKIETIINENNESKEHKNDFDDCSNFNVNDDNLIKSESDNELDVECNKSTNSVSKWRRKVKDKKSIKDNEILHNKVMFQSSIRKRKIQDKTNRLNKKKDEKSIKYIKNKLIMCEECGSKFPDLYSLRIHKRVHRDEKPFTCDTCERKFASKGNRDTHVSIIHMQNRKFQCEQCPKSFAYFKNLKEHRRSHTGEKPYICDTCDRQFTHHFSMVRHRLTHIQAKPYGCIHCYKTYTQSNDLKAHVKKFHTGKPINTLADYCLKLPTSYPVKK